MHENLVQQIKHDPNYKELVSKRSSFSLKLSLSILVVYFSFILTIAFKPELLAITISDSSVITIGVPVGIMVIVFAFILTGLYTRRANSEFDELTRKIKDKINE
ncbi:DUF485 domain-containing protein [Sulfurimonas sp.]|nr:DUF485 domain-containing protein [Sulfurimonas sp.]